MELLFPTLASTSRGSDHDLLSISFHLHIFWELS